MTLFDCNKRGGGKITDIGGNINVRRRLYDLGLVDSDFTVKAKNRRSVLADFGHGFCAVLAKDAAENIKVIERI